MDSSDSKQKQDILTIQEILASDNVAEILSDQKLTDISKQVFDDYSKDLSSFEDKRNQLQDIVAMAKMIAKEKSYPWNGASNVIYPLIANAAIEFGATLYPEIVKDSEVVKARVIGKDEGYQVKNAEGPMINEDGTPVLANVGAKKARGERVATYMNHQLLDKMQGWEIDVDRLGNSSPVLGNLYKKIFWDSLNEMPVSELIYPDKIVINNGAKNIKDAVVTHIIELYPNEIMSRIRSGIFKDFDYNYEIDKENQSDPSDINNIGNLDESLDYGNNTKLNTFYEQHTFLDLDDDGFPEPYIITVHSESTNVVRIVPRFTKKDVKYNSKKEVKHIKAKQYFVKYGFIPSPDGSFFDMGFGHLLYNINISVNSSINQLFDAGHLANTGGGFIGKMKGLPKGRLALSPGEWKQVDAFGDDISRNIVPIPQPQPNQTMFALLGYMVEAGKGMALLRDVLTGENAGNIAATTQISMVEQGMKQFKAIYKRFYKSLKDELQLLYDLIGEHGDNEEYAKVLDEPIINVDIKMDFDNKGYDICPVADIDAVTSYQRMAQAAFLMQFVGNPNIDQMDLLKRVMEIARVDNVDKLVIPTAPSVNPLIEVEQLKAQVKTQEIQLKAQEAAQKNAIEIQLAIANIEKLKAEIEKIHTSSMVDLANVSQIGASINDAQQEREVKIMDNIIDQETKKIEVEGRLIDAQIKREIELAKAFHQERSMAHEKEMINKKSKETDQESLENE